MTTELARTEPNTLAATEQRQQPPAALAELWSLAKGLAASDIIPDTYRGKTANCLIALQQSQRLGVDVLSVMGGLYLIHGRVSWSGQFLITMINRSKLFSRLDYKLDGKEGTPDRQCCAFATELSTGKVLIGPTVSIKMAELEKWGPKWKSMPEVMLRYRSASLWVKTQCPEVMAGIPDEYESEDAAYSERGAQRFSLPSTKVETLQLPEVTTQPEPKSEPKSESVRMREPGEEG